MENRIKFTFGDIEFLSTNQIKARWDISTGTLARLIERAQPTTRVDFNRHYYLKSSVEDMMINFKERAQ